MTTRSQSVRRIRGQGGQSLKGFIVTWDVDSRNASLCARLRRFMFGYEIRTRGRIYRYPGLVERDGVRYLGQSVVFVTKEGLPVLESFLSSNRVDCVVTVAGIGPIMPNRAEGLSGGVEASEPVAVAGEPES